jgi:hypothetical protein
MKISPDDQHLIEQYINGTLSAETRSVFEQRLSDEPELARELAAARLIQTELSDPNQLRLLQTLQQITAAPPRRPAGWFVAAILAICLLGGGWWWWTSHSAPASPAPEQPAAPVPVETRPQTAPVPEKTTPKPPIAALDPRRFDPNPSLEPLVGAQLRGGDMEVTFEGAPEVRKTANGWSVFDNRERSWKLNRPLRREPLSVTPEKTPDAYRFQQTIFLQTPPGRYYLLVTEKGSAEPLATNKTSLNE